MRRFRRTLLKSMNWIYEKRPDGRIAVTLDNNVWDFLFAQDIDLATELPAEAFALFIPREVEIEHLAIPNLEAKVKLKKFISRTIAEAGVETTYVFGFGHDGSGPQRVGGFDVGVWQSQTAREFYNAIRPLYLLDRKETGSRLNQNEGDAAVASKAFFSIVLTCERPQKPGPIRYAAEHGGKVVYLPSVDRSVTTLRDHLRTIHAAP